MSGNNVGDGGVSKNYIEVQNERKFEGKRNQGDEANGRFYEIGLKNMEDEHEYEYTPQFSDLDLPRYKKRYVPGRGMERYSKSLKNLIPIRRKKRDMGTMPIENAGLFSYISFSWLSKFMYKAYRKELTMEELPSIPPYDSCDYTTERLESLWEAELLERGSEKASFTRVVWRFCRTRIFASWIVFTCSLAFGFISPTLVMRNLLEYVQLRNGLYGEGFKWAVALTLTELLRATFFSWAWAINYTTALRLRSACLTLLYKKLIRCNNLGNKSIGEIINIFTNDAQRIFDMILFGSMMIGGPIVTVWGIFYVLWLLGPMALSGMAIFLLFYPLQYLISHLTGYFRTKSVKICDLRVRMMGEILDCIKLIKMYAWERRFNQDLFELRKREQRLLEKTSYCQGFSVSMAPTIPIISAVITFLAHLSTGSNLTAAQAFPLSTFFGNQIKQALIRLREGSQALVDSIVAFRRLKSILLMEEGNCSIFKPILKSQAVTISDGTFSCVTFGNRRKESSETNQKKRKKERRTGEDKSGKENLGKPMINPEYVDILFKISFEATKGKLVGICGPVGSGKSSLLLAALGQLRISEGQVARDGECAYVSQQAWITNATLKENILFGAKFDKKWYNQVIWACSLSQDIAAMPGGDETEIGERGINLSGGQKQRVALARALYADRDIYLLDDPLSAVDSRVGSHIFDNLILGALKEKTVLFVTHQIQYLNRCDDVYMMRDGRIVEHGTHDDLMKLDNEYASMVAAISANNESNQETDNDQGIESLAQLVSNDCLHNTSRTNSLNSRNNLESVKKPQTSDTLFTVADDLKQGTIQWQTYHSYIKAAGGYVFASVVILTFLANVASTTFSSWWLALWIKAGGGNTTTVVNNKTIISDNLNDNPDFSYYQTIYALTIGVILLTSLCRTLAFTKATVGASTKLHNNLFRKIIQSPMRFFETTPSGRIQHLFSRDMDEVDNRLPINLTSFVQNVFIILSSFLVICLVLPWFILPLCVICTLYYFISKIFKVAITDLKRMENKSRAPIISYVTATIQGLSTIHAFEKENEFMTNFTEMFDDNSKYMFLCCLAMRWLAIRIDVLSVIVTGITAFLVIVLQDHVPAALAGLALSYSSQISGILQYTIRLVSETEVRFISVEKINHYLATLTSEGNAKQYVVKPQSSWPAAAQLKFENVSLAYGKGAPFILKNLSFTVEAGEKIGIVGRTGAGKSSLTVALFRLVELAEGKIEIDDVDISEISLGRLRTKLSIIPQDPVLFSGTIRSNLDPFDLYADSQIWDALEKTELKNRVRSISGQLDASVGFGGDNMSVGERQLLCLSRALLRNSKILVLDEATAAVDPETEKAVQNTIQQEFSQCTILTIAHRLQTVLSLDRVLVMDSGKILEFDTPSNLLGNPNSEFSKMMAAAHQSTRQKPRLITDQY